MTSGATPAAKRKSLKWMRLGVMMHETSDFKPLLGLGASRDGGLVLSPGDYIPSNRWEYGIASMPSGRYVGLPGGGIDRSTVVAIDVAPKLHYHRSGWVTVDLMGRSEKRILRCLPMVRMLGDQLFSFTARGCEHVPTEGLKRGDAYVVEHGADWPAAVTVHGFLYPTDRVPMIAGLAGAGGPVGLVQNSAAEIVVDLRPNGIDSLLALRFSRHTSGPRRTSASATLFGFDYRATDLDTMSDAVGMWSDPDESKPVRLYRPEHRPFQTLDLARASYKPDISNVTRTRTYDRGDSTIVSTLNSESGTSPG